MAGIWRQKTNLFWAGEARELFYLLTQEKETDLQTNPHCLVVRPWFKTSAGYQDKSLSFRYSLIVG